MAVDNQTLVAKAWLEGSNAFQQRVPNPTQTSLAATAQALQDPMNADMWNEFQNLMNMVGFTIILNRAWENPLAFMKKDPMRYGKTLRMVAPKWIKAHAFKDDSEKLLKMDRVEWEQWFHTVDRADVYDFDYNETELMWALSDDGASNSINTLLDSAATAAMNSDNYDEMQIMIQQFAVADKNWKNPLFRRHFDATPYDETSGKEFLTQLQADVNRLRFPSTLFNSLEVPVFARQDELVLFVTPEADASVNVNTLASLFNVGLADVQPRKIMIPEFPLPGVFAALTTRDWLECRDTKYGIFPFFDPSTLTTHNYLHHQGIYSASPYVPCILYTTDASTEVPTIVMNATDLSLTAESDTIEVGGTLQLDIDLLGSISANEYGYSVQPDSATYTVTLANGAINSRTYVDKYGVLHLQKSGVEAGDVVTVVATSTYVNPSGQTVVYTATLALTVTETASVPSAEYTVTYNVTGDSTYGIPADGAAPAAQEADEGTTVTLYSPLTTSWTTSDGTASGVAGTWEFAGWSLTEGGDVVTYIAEIAADADVYGVWTFTAE